MKQVLIEPHYLGSLEYFVLLLAYDEVIWDVHEHFRKQTYRNRCYVLSASGPQPLIVPVSYGNRTKLKEVRIDYRQSWIREHWGAFYSAYGKAPFFDFFAGEFRAIWESKPEFLVDLNYQMMTLCLNLLRIDRSVKFSEFYHSATDTGILDLRNRIHPKIPFGERKIYLPFQYIQNFGSNFEPNPSIVDLLLCEGNRAAEVLRKSRFSANEHL